MHSPRHIPRKPRGPGSVGALQVASPASPLRSESFGEAGPSEVTDPTSKVALAFLVPEVESAWGENERWPQTLGWHHRDPDPYLIYGIFQHLYNIIYI